MKCVSLKFRLLLRFVIFVAEFNLAISDFTPFIHWLLLFYQSSRLLSNKAKVEAFNQQRIQLFFEKKAVASFSFGSKGGVREPSAIFSVA